MKLEGWLFDEGVLDPIDLDTQDERELRENSKGLHVIGTCGECKKKPEECEYFRRIFGYENFTTIARQYHKITGTKSFKKQIEGERDGN